MSKIEINKFFNNELPPSGFILQKDVYTTNLLYANDQFPLTSLKSRLPFRKITGMKGPDPNNSIKILRENGKISKNSDDKQIFYYFNKFKPKDLLYRKIKLPLPKVKTIPLTYKNLYENISNKYVRIRNLEDDLNIPSLNGRRIIYKFKENKKLNAKRRGFSRDFNKELEYENKKLNMSLDKGTLKQIIRLINYDLHNIKQREMERKKSFIKDKFFSTQIIVEKILDPNNFL